MRILILGAGVVGLNLAQQLSQEGHDIRCLDKDHALLQEIQERMDIMVVYGDAAKPSDLRAADIEKTDMVIAVTNSDALNLLACQIAGKFQVSHRVARIRNPELVGKGGIFTPQDLGIERVISPETIAMDTINRFMQTPGAIEVADFAGGEIRLCAFNVQESSPFAGVQLKDVRDSVEFHNFLIVAIEREDGVIIPKGEEEVKVGDLIFVILEKEKVHQFLPYVSERYHEIKKVVIFAATQLGKSLAIALESQVEKVILVEPNMKRAEEAASTLSSHVVCGDITDEEILSEIGMKNADYFIALSPDDEINILSCLFAKQHGAHYAITLENTSKYSSLIHYMDIDVVINPKLLTVGKILKDLRRGRISSVAKLYESEAEVIELEVLGNSPVVGHPLKSVNFPKDALIGAIIRHGSMIIPTGENMVYAGDKVILFALPHAISKIEKLFDRS